MEALEVIIPGPPWAQALAQAPCRAGSWRRVARYHQAGFLCRALSRTNQPTPADPLRPYGLLPCPSTPDRPRPRCYNISLHPECLLSAPAPLRCSQCQPTPCSATLYLRALTLLQYVVKFGLGLSINCVLFVKSYTVQLSGQILNIFFKFRWTIVLSLMSYFSHF